MSEGVLERRLAQQAQLGRVLFYPSAGEHVWPLLASSYDVYIFVDLGAHLWTEALLQRAGAAGATDVYAGPDGVTFRLREKQVFYFRSTNEQVIRILRRQERRIHCFIGVNDGCREGGNAPERCVNDVPVLLEIFELLANGASYLTDHPVAITQRPALPILAASFFPEPYPEFILPSLAVLRGEHEDRRRWHVSRSWDSEDTLIQKSLRPQYGPAVYSYRVHLHHPRERSWQCGKVRLSVIHDTIHSAWAGTSGLLLTSSALSHGADLHWSARTRSEGSMTSAVRPGDAWFLSPRRVSIVSKRQIRGPAREFASWILRETRTQGWSDVATIPFGMGVHRGVREELARWEGPPLHVRIFHVDAGDLLDLGYPVECSERR